MPPSQDMRELLQLTRENNTMLRSMQRRAFWGGIVKFLVYTGLFVALPLWAYVTYLSPILDQMMKTYAEIQGTGARAEAQFGDIQNFFKQFQNAFPKQR